MIFKDLNRNNYQRPLVRNCSDKTFSEKDIILAERDKLLTLCQQNTEYMKNVTKEELNPGKILVEGMFTLARFEKAMAVYNENEFRQMLKNKNDLTTPTYYLECREEDLITETEAFKRFVL